MNAFTSILCGFFAVTASACLSRTEAPAAALESKSVPLSGETWVSAPLGLADINKTKGGMILIGQPFDDFYKEKLRQLGVLEQAEVWEIWVDASRGNLDGGILTESIMVIYAGGKGVLYTGRRPIERH